MIQLLLWIERHSDDAITDVECSSVMSSCELMINHMDLLEASHQMWSYPHLNSVGAEVIEGFRSVELLSGAEAWRRIVAPIVKHSGPKRTALRNRVWKPKQVSKVAGFTGCLEQWETDMRNFIAASGEPMSNPSKMDTIIQVLPSDMTHWA